MYTWSWVAQDLRSDKGRVSFSEREQRWYKKLKREPRSCPGSQGKKQKSIELDFIEGLSNTE